MWSYENFKYITFCQLLEHLQLVCGKIHIGRCAKKKNVLFQKINWFVFFYSKHLKAKSWNSDIYEHLMFQINIFFIFRMLHLSIACCVLNSRNKIPNKQISKHCVLLSYLFTSCHMISNGKIIWLPWYSFAIRYIKLLYTLWR